MLASDGYLKMIDFGFAKHVPKRTFTTCGTPDYLAPEVILQEGHNSAADWWTLGVFLYETHTGFAPFADDDPMKTGGLTMDELQRMRVQKEHSG